MLDAQQGGERCCDGAWCRHSEGGVSDKFNRRISPGDKQV